MVSMELIRGLHNIKPRHRGCVATIGNFDGVHLGHQAVIAQLADVGQQLGLPTLVMSFEPQPLEYFQPDKAPARLTRLREKLRALARYAVDRVLIVEFNEHFAALEAQAFIDEMLVRRLGVRYLVVGDDFRFGKGRQGDFAMLQQAGRQQGFEVVDMRTFDLGGERVSSTRIREALAAGDLELAAQLLGRPYRMCGRVAHGDKIGRELGIPTANIHLHRKVSPLQGIYMVEVTGVDHRPWPGAASVGTRPTVGGTRALLEIHLLDFAGDIYGRHLSVDFYSRIRGEEKFDTLELLKARMQQDIAETRAWFANRGIRRHERQ